MLWHFDSSQGQYMFSNKQITDNIRMTIKKTVVVVEYKYVQRVQYNTFAVVLIAPNSTTAS